MEEEALAVFLALQGQLALQSLGIYADTHAAEFDAPAQGGIPHQQVTIESQESFLVGGAPVIIVGCTQVVLLAVGQLAADAHDEHSPILLTDEVFALLGSLVGIHAQQLLAVDEMYLLGQEVLQLGISLTDVELGAQDGAVDLADNVLEESNGTLLGQYHTLPVPLIDIEAVDIVEFLIGADGIHVGDDTETGVYLIVGQSDSLPLGQTVYHLGYSLVHILDRETDRALHTVQVIIQSQPAQHKQRCSHPAQTEFGAQSTQKKVLYIGLFLQFCLLDGQFGLLQIQQGTIALRFHQFTHLLSSLLPFCFQKTRQNYTFISTLSPYLGRNVNFCLPERSFPHPILPPLWL